MMMSATLYDPQDGRSPSSDSSAQKRISPKGRGGRARRESQTILRRGTRQQGRALEALGHAVEYLVDSRMFQDDAEEPAERKALQMLMRASRAVFAECAEVISLRQRFTRWIEGRSESVTDGKVRTAEIRAREENHEKGLRW